MRGTSKSKGKEKGKGTSKSKNNSKSRNVSGGGGSGSGSDIPYVQGAGDEEDGDDFEFGFEEGEKAFIDEDEEEDEDDIDIGISLNGNHQKNGSSSSSSSKHTASSDGNQPELEQEFASNGRMKPMKFESAPNNPISSAIRKAIGGRWKSILLLVCSVAAISLLIVAMKASTSTQNSNESSSNSRDSSANNKDIVNNNAKYDPSNPEPKEGTGPPTPTWLQWDESDNDLINKYHSDEHDHDRDHNHDHDKTESEKPDEATPKFPTTVPPTTVPPTNSPTEPKSATNSKSAATDDKDEYDEDGMLKTVPPSPEKKGKGNQDSDDSDKDEYDEDGMLKTVPPSPEKKGKSNQNSGDSDEAKSNQPKTAPPSPLAKQKKGEDQEKGPESVNEKNEEQAKEKAIVPTNSPTHLQKEPKLFSKEKLEFWANLKGDRQAMSHRLKELLPDHKWHNSVEIDERKKYCAQEKALKESKFPTEYEFPKTPWRTTEDHPKPEEKVAQELLGFNPSTVRRQLEQYHKALKEYYETDDEIMPCFMPHAGTPERDIWARVLGEKLVRKVLKPKYDPKHGKANDNNNNKKKKEQSKKKKEAEEQSDQKGGETDQEKRAKDEQSTTTKGQSDFIVGVMGTSVMAGMDNCWRLAFPPQFERTLKQLLGPMGINALVHGMGQNGDGPTMTAELSCVKSHFVDPENPDRINLDAIVHGWWMMGPMASGYNMEAFLRRMIVNDISHIGLFPFTPYILPHSAKKKNGLAGYTPGELIQGKDNRAMGKNVSKTKKHGKAAYLEGYFNTGLFADATSEWKTCPSKMGLKPSWYRGLKKNHWGKPGEGACHMETREGENGIMMQNWHPGPLGFQVMMDEILPLIIDGMYSSLDLLQSTVAKHGSQHKSMDKALGDLYRSLTEANEARLKQQLPYPVQFLDLSVNSSDPMHNRCLSDRKDDPMCSRDWRKTIEPVTFECATGVGPRYGKGTELLDWVVPTEFTQFGPDEKDPTPAATRGWTHTIGKKSSSVGQAGSHNSSFKHDSSCNKHPDKGYAFKPSALSDTSVVNSTWLTLALPPVQKGDIFACVYGRGKSFHFNTAGLYFALDKPSNILPPCDKENPYKKYRHGCLCIAMDLLPWRHSRVLGMKITGEKPKFHMAEIMVR